MKLAIYPGTFDPITNGHTDLIERASGLFDQVILAVARDTGKQTTCSAEERVALAAEVLSGYQNVRVEIFDGMLVEYAKQRGAQVVIRGLRAVSDFEYELQLAGMNRRMAPEVETLFLTPAEDCAFISSSLVREIARLGGNVSGFVHPSVQRVLESKFRAAEKGSESN